MSVGNSTGISFSGLSSGIDVNSIVTQLMSLEKRPLSRFNLQKQELQQSTNVYQELKSRINSFTSSLSALTSSATFNPMKAASSTTETATASASVTATEGSYSVTVYKLSQAHKISSTAQASTSNALGTTGKFKVNGKEITVEASDSLANIAQKINDADASVTASIINGGTNNSFLSLTADKAGASNAIQIEDVEGPALAALGSFGTQILAAQNADFEVDGVRLESDKNTIADVLPGVTLTLGKAALDGSVKTTVTVSRDTTAVKERMKTFRDAYNNVVGFIREASQFDADTFASGPLFGDSTAAQVEAGLASVVFSSVGSGTVRNVAQLGFSFEEDGTLKFDESAFDKIAASNPSDIAKVFAASGSSANGSLRYVSSSNRSVTGVYSVDITQAATLSSGTASTAQTQVSGGGEVITFGGALFNNASIILTTSGGTASDLVSQINNDTRIKDLVKASLDNDGKLVLESKRYGAAGVFTAASSEAASDSNSGIGTTGLSVAAGLDVAGTINGETATGNGQFLMGATGNARTEGLQIMYTGTATGAVGEINFTQGLANMLDGTMKSFTDSVNGVITAAVKANESQIQDIDLRIAKMNESFVLKEQYLRQKFARMEEAMAKLQSQGGQVANMVSQSRAQSG